MKKIVFLISILLFLQHSYSQQSKQTWTEDFDGSLPPSGWTIAAGSWKTNTVFHLPGSSVSSPQSYQGLVPHQAGDSTILVTPIFDCSQYNNVFVRFSHICKVSPLDSAWVEYRVNAGPLMGQWNPLTWDMYRGLAPDYFRTGFSARTYPEWQANNATVIPHVSWWREELFDLRDYANFARVQFRFVILHKTVQGTQVSYGWLLDNFELMAANYPITPPTVRMVEPLVKDTAYGTGPWDIFAKVKTNTAAPIQTPCLNYVATYNGKQVDTGTVLMTPVSGDSLWKASVPQYTIGTEVAYLVKGQDVDGNYATANSGYTIVSAMGMSDYIYFGAADSLGGTTNQNAVLAHGYANSWSRHLYLNSELKDLKIRDYVLLKNIAFRMTGLSTVNRTSVRIYLKATNQTGQPRSYETPVTDGATLVYEGPMNFVFPDWIDISFDTSFWFPEGSNLMVYVEDDSPTATNFAGINWRLSGTNTGMSVYGRWVGENYGYAAKPVTRFRLEYPDYGASSIAVDAINTKDTVDVRPGITIPIIATIRNKGASDLSSVTIYYSVNGQAPVFKNIAINPALIWDMNVTDTLGYYTPKVNGTDTLTVWASNPNGVADRMTFDDTLQKMIYGGSDIRIKAIQVPADTVYLAKDYDITLEIYTLSGAPIPTPISLFVTTTLEGNTVRDTLLMQSSGSNVWTITIPKKKYESDVSYTLSFIDVWNNSVVLKGGYYIKGMIGIDDWVEVGEKTTTTSSNGPPAYGGGYGSYSYCRMLYDGSDIANNGCLITKFSWNYASTTVTTFKNQTCYFLAVDATTVTALYTDPVADGATLVWKGDLGLTAQGWIDFTLDEPFVLPPGKNLLIYWHNEHGSALNLQWYHHVVGRSVTVYGAYYGSFAAATTATATLSNSRPNVRFYLAGRTGLDHSVSLIDVQPSKSAAAGLNPVQLTLQNIRKDKFIFL